MCVYSNIPDKNPHRIAELIMPNGEKRSLKVNIEARESCLHDFRNLNQ